MVLDARLLFFACLDFTVFLLADGAAFPAGAATGAAAGVAGVTAPPVWATTGVEITAKGMAKTAALARMVRNFFMVIPVVEGESLGRTYLDSVR